jgi:hypothetical protein
MISEKWSNVWLRITSEVLTHEEISRRLAAIPTRARNRGEPRSRHSPQAGVQPFTVWTLEFPEGENDGLESQFALLLAFAEANLDRLEGLGADCDMDAWCTFGSESGQGSFIILADVLKRFARVNLNLILSLYPPGRIDDEDLMK